MPSLKLPELADPGPLDSLWPLSLRQNPEYTGPRTDQQEPIQRPNSRMTAFGQLCRRGVRSEALKLFALAAPAVIQSIATFSSADCAVSTTWCAGVSPDRLSPGTLRGFSATIVVSESGRDRNVGARTLRKVPASKAATNFEQTAKQGVAKAVSHMGRTLTESEIQERPGVRKLRASGNLNGCSDVHTRQSMRFGGLYGCALLANHLHN